ncbi:hypothetical protein QQP08_026902 [Theobroma cacao]|nr:hypothetical protein QQP08_026902 [Theobroma cacao]
MACNQHHIEWEYRQFVVAYDYDRCLGIIHYYEFNSEGPNFFPKMREERQQTKAFEYLNTIGTDISVSLTNTHTRSNPDTVVQPIRPCFFIFRFCFVAPFIRVRTITRDTWQDEKAGALSLQFIQQHVISFSTSLLHCGSCFLPTALLPCKAYKRHNYRSRK